MVNQKMMQRFTPKTLLYNRLELTEELSFDSQTGQQVWAVWDHQTNQKMIGRFYVDGRVEWFNDNRDKATATPVDIRQAPAAPALSESVQTKPLTERKKPVGLFVVIMLLLGTAGGAYYYRAPLLTYVDSIRRIMSSDSRSQTTNSQIPDTSADPTNAGETKENFPSDPLPTFSAEEATSISPQQANRLLLLLGRIPTEKHPAIFRDARKAFNNLRQVGENDRFVDSLYTFCAGRGAQSFLTHQQNGDLTSKNYAIEWYQTAYALKPSVALKERLDRLKNISQKRRKQNSAPKKSRETLFLADPEVNR